MKITYQQKIYAWIQVEINRIPKDVKSPCGCGSGTAYDVCCSPYHKGEASALDAEALLRSRYTAYAYRLPSYLVSTTKKFAPASTAEAVLTNKKSGEKKAIKAEKEELLKFIDSYDFSALEVLG